MGGIRYIRAITTDDKCFMQMLPWSIINPIDYCCNSMPVYLWTTKTTQWNTHGWRSIETEGRRNNPGTRYFIKPQIRLGAGTVVSLLTVEKLVKVEDRRDLVDLARALSTTGTTYSFQSHRSVLYSLFNEVLRLTSNDLPDLSRKPKIRVQWHFISDWWKIPWSSAVDEWAWLHNESTVTQYHTSHIHHWAEI